ncbi:hypothetical protein [Phytohabitans rumicis]|uniref:hypothetical protein n=1 Tax=Phytohabitans rumicis TaxID=1076125 RepID=UPI0031EEF551
MLVVAVGAAAAYPLAGCDLFEDDAKQTPAPPDALAPLLAEALDLATQHEAAVAAFPELAARLTPVAAAHRAHAAELARITKVAAPASPTASPSAPAAADVKATLATLRAAEQKGQKAAAAACRTAPADRAALLGSIAAARTTHLEVTR